MRISACLLLRGISVKNLSLGAPDEKEDACQSSQVSKREASPLKKGKSTQTLCIALDPRQALYPIPLGPVCLGLGAGRLKLDL